MATSSDVLHQIVVTRDHRGWRTYRVEDEGGQRRITVVGYNRTVVAADRTALQAAIDLANQHPCCSVEVLLRQQGRFVIRKEDAE